MKQRYYLGIDQGTTGTRAVLFNRYWEVAATGYCKINLSYPHNGWVEHDGEAVWNSVLSATADAMKEAAVTPEEIASIGIDHEGETVLIWDRSTGKPLAPSIVWQDRRTAHYIEQISDTYNELIWSRTGLRADSYFSASKYHWLLNNVPEAKPALAAGNLLGGTMGTWILWKMTGGRHHVTDLSTASRTLLLDAITETWSPELLNAFEIPEAILPAIQDSTLTGIHADPEHFLGISAPIGGLLVDQQSALLGQACTEIGDVKTTYGTGCFMLMNTGDQMVQSENGLLTTIGWRAGGRTTCALDGGIYITGAATSWITDELQLVKTPAETEAMALSVADTNGVYFVPAFSGLAAPHWDSYARGTIVGITGGTRKAHLVRATLESTAYQVYDVLKAMRKDSGIDIPVMRCNGKATDNRFLMQFQSDILGIPLEIPANRETTALGCAFLGAIGRGEYSSISEIEQIWHCAARYEPKMEEDHRMQLLYDWHRAIERSKYWNED